LKRESPLVETLRRQLTVLFEKRQCARRRRMRAVTLEEFKASLAASGPPDVAPPLLALWRDARGEWEAAHTIAQDIDNPTGAWIHAYLHRKEGDLGNAAYWYRHANQPVASDSLDEEWQRIVVALL
jgi:hypothetical protein